MLLLKGLDEAQGISVDGDYCSGPLRAARGTGVHDADAFKEIDRLGGGPPGKSEDALIERLSEPVSAKHRTPAGERRVGGSCVRVAESDLDLSQGREQQMDSVELV